ncbi:hypothetical protein FIBSPDRAFT_939669 [Athelia psychrophila]|uniref:Uncharacterized protein n=1 Tax=Athelia psychrophila TaxID=1759441 RepID=A0A167XF41_9AGAM|nr:hypothetical protein FIBSPDRAFT_939669 [Fibularhizoctonia sp. CBS 109695]
MSENTNGDFVGRADEEELPRESSVIGSRKVCLFSEYIPGQWGRPPVPLAGQLLILVLPEPVEKKEERELSQPRSMRDISDGGIDRAGVRAGDRSSGAAIWELAMRDQWVRKMRKLQNVGGDRGRDLAAGRPRGRFAKGSGHRIERSGVEGLVEVGL